MTHEKNSALSYTMFEYELYNVMYCTYVMVSCYDICEHWDIMYCVNVNDITGCLV